MSGGWAFGQEWCNNQSIGMSTAAATMTALTVSTTSANTKNTYTQLIASTAGDINVIDLSITNSGNPAINSGIYTDIAIGAAASEVVILNNLLIGTSTVGSGSHMSRWCIPVNIPNASRVSARFAASTTTNTSTGNGSAVGIQGYDTGFSGQAGFAGMDAVGQTNGVGTTLTSTTTALIKSAYYQVTASTTRDYAGFILGFDQSTTSMQYLVDVALGAAGSEKIIVNNHNYIEFTNQRSPISSLIMVPIPFGTRVSARVEASVANGKANLTVYGLYA